VDSGKITSELKLGEEVEKNFGAPFLCLQRRASHAIESTVAPEIVHFGMKLVTWTECARSHAHLCRRHRARADAVIGADGVHSVVRETLFDGRSRVSPGASRIAPSSRPHAWARPASAPCRRNVGT